LWPDPRGDRIEVALLTSEEIVGIALEVKQVEVGHQVIPPKVGDVAY
jgi:hypothetical protein